MWKLGIDYLYNPALNIESEEGTEIEGKEWKQVALSGKFPSKIAHHQAVVQETNKELIVYGGIVGIEATDLIHLVDLKNFSFTAIPAAQQKEKNGKPLPGPRDDFALLSFNGDQGKVKPIFLVGGFKNGSKMNDIYKLH
jgi:hypothetical protein